MTAGRLEYRDATPASALPARIAALVATLYGPLNAIFFGPDAYRSLFEARARSGLVIVGVVSTVLRGLNVAEVLASLVLGICGVLWLRKAAWARRPFLIAALILAGELFIRQAAASWMRFAVGRENAYEQIVKFCDHVRLATLPAMLLCLMAYSGPRARSRRPNASQYLCVVAAVGALAFSMAPLFELTDLIVRAVTGRLDDYFEAGRPLWWNWWSAETLIAAVALSAYAVACLMRRTYRAGFIVAALVVAGGYLVHAAHLIAIAGSRHQSGLDGLSYALIEILLALAPATMAYLMHMSRKIAVPSDS